MELLYSKMKIFHFKDKLDSLSIEKKLVLPPLHIRIKPTNMRSHNCWYCGYRRENIQLYGLIKRLKDIGVDNVKLAPCLVSDSGKENNKYRMCAKLS